MSVNSTLPSYYLGLTGEFLTQTGAQRRSGLSRSSSIKNMQLIGETQQDESSYSLRINVDGVDPRDIAVVVDQRSLVVEFEKEYEPTRVARTAWDKAYGVFRRRFEIPADSDASRILYSVNHGELRITLYKTGADVGLSPEQSRDLGATSQLPDLDRI